MKTNIGIETSDEQRLKIGKTLGVNRMISRKELREEIENHVNLLIEGTRVYEETQRPTREDAKGPPALVAETSRDRSIRGFVPSRGDETYLYSGKDSELAAVCSSLLDACEFIQGYAWEALERNRK